MKKELKNSIGTNEKILYEGKPKRICYILEGIFNPMLPFALMWFAFDLFFIMEALSQAFPLFFVFFAFHLMPVWLYLAGAICVGIKYKNTNYIVTDKAIYISHGIIHRNINSKPFSEVSHIDIHRGIFDRMFNVGDIIATTNQMLSNNIPATIKIESISNYMDIYKLIKKLQTDVYSDIMYPNAKRPKENYGYNTEYKEL